MSLEINHPGSESSSVSPGEKSPSSRHSEGGGSLPKMSLENISTTSSANNQKTPTKPTLFPSSLSSFDEDVLETWTLGLPSDEFIRELLEGTQTNTDLGPLQSSTVDPNDLLPIEMNNTPLDTDMTMTTPADEEGLKTTLMSETLSLPLIQYEIPTILLEEDEDQPPTQLMTKSRGRPRLPKVMLQKRPRGRPLGSATKSRVIPVPQSENEAKYVRMRDLNNAASRRCRMNRKQKLQSMLMDEVEMRKYNAQLREEVQRKEELIKRLKSRLIALASSTDVLVLPLVAPNGHSINIV